MIDAGEHVGLAIALGRKYGRGVPDPEAVLEAALFSLLAAAGRFDPERGTWAAFAAASVAMAARGEAARQFREPRSESLHFLGDGGDEEERRDLPHVDPVGSARLEARELRETLALLAPREREILVRHFGLDGPEETLEEIAARLGLSLARVGQLQRRALGTLRRVLSRRRGR